MDLKKLLNDYKEGKITQDEALNNLKKLPYDDLGFAKIDNHRHLRKGFPEVIYCQGKTDEHIEKILDNMNKSTENILATRAKKTTYEKIKSRFKNATYNELARTITIRNKAMENTGKGKILIITAGTSDIPVAEEAKETASIMGNNVETIYDCGVAGVHRLLNQKEKIDSANVIIAVAGMEGALPSVIGGLTSKPIIAVPTSVGYGASFEGLAPLLTMLNSCSPGIVTVNIDNGFGAGYFASLINK